MIKKLGNQKGQAVLEYIMITAVMVILWSGVSRTLQQRGIFQSLFGDSWARLSNTIEFGVPADRKQQASSAHPLHSVQGGSRPATKEARP